MKFRNELLRFSRKNHFILIGRRTIVLEKLITVDNVSYSINPPSPRTSRHLCIFVTHKESHILSVEFRKTRKYGGFDRTIESDGERFGCEKQFDIFLRYHNFDDFSQDGNHSRMMNADSAFQKFDELMIFGKF